VSTNIGHLSAMMTTSKSIDRGDRFPADVIEQAVWLYFRSACGWSPCTGHALASGEADAF
jgi:hypothetical protein